jgi:hypothetical protein
MVGAMGITVLSEGVVVEAEYDVELMPDIVVAMAFLSSTDCVVLYIFWSSFMRLSLCILPSCFLIKTIMP